MSKASKRKSPRKRLSRRALLVIVCCAGVAVAAGLAVGLWLGRAERPPEEGTEVGMLAPDFTLEDLQGNTVNLSDFRGRPVLLYFWQSDCPDCRVAFPEMIELFQLYEGEGLALVTVSLDQDEDSMRSYVEENVPPGPVNLWGSYDEAMDVIRLYGSPWVPHAVLFDRQGMIRFRGTHPRLPMEPDVEDVL